MAEEKKAARRKAKAKPAGGQEAQAVRKYRQYGVTEEEFVREWTAAAAAGEGSDGALRRMAAVSQGRGLPAMSRLTMQAKAAEYRRKYPDLPRFKPGRKKKDAAQLEAVNGLIRATSKAGAAAVAAPPPVQTAMLMDALRKLLGERAEEVAAPAPMAITKEQVVEEAARQLLRRLGL